MNAKLLETTALRVPRRIHERRVTFLVYFQVVEARFPQANH